MEEVSGAIKSAAVVLNISTAVLILIVIFSAIAIVIVTLVSVAMCAVGVRDIVKFAKKEYEKHKEAQELKEQAEAPSPALQQPEEQNDGPVVDIHRIVELDEGPLRKCVVNSPGDCVGVQEAQVAQYVGFDESACDEKAAIASNQSSQRHQKPSTNFNSVSSAQPMDLQEQSDQQSDVLYQLTHREDSSSADERVVNFMRFEDGGKPEFSFMPAGGALQQRLGDFESQNSAAENSALTEGLISRQRRMENSIVGGVENSVIAQYDAANTSQNVSVNVEMSFRAEQGHEGMDNSIGPVMIANSMAVSNADLSASQECAPTLMEDVEMRENLEEEQAVFANEHLQGTSQARIPTFGDAEAEDLAPQDNGSADVAEDDEPGREATGPASGAEAES